jgi:hypothetical protein
MQYLLGLIIGIGLSAACGFRVFVPLLGMSIASLSGHLNLASGFEWIGTWPAFAALATATILEIGAFYIPWIDNMMDAAATPAAIVAGTMITASQLGDMSPMLKWALAVVAGGGVCGMIQTGTVAARAVSTGTTGGLGNFVLSSLELAAALAMTITAIIVPVVGFILTAILLYLAVMKTVQWLTMQKVPDTEEILLRTRRLP